MAKVYTGDELIKMITKIGWVYDSQTGSHRHYEHPEIPGKITIMPGSSVMAKKTANRILKQAGLR